jgi:hypothetical protein
MGFKVLLAPSGASIFNRSKALKSCPHVEKKE